MRNPWVALDAFTDPIGHARALSRVHERSVRGGLNGANATRGVRELVLASWRRSLAAGVTPDDQGPQLVLSDDQLRERREHSPLAGAVDAIFTSLSSLDGDVRHVVAVADADANLLWVRGEWRAMELAHRMRFVEGAAWSEATAGTNAVGTAVALDHAVQIFSAEHLVAAVHPWTCSAAPIHDPVTRRLIGVVDLTSDLRTAHPHTLSLATLAAQAAEAKLRFDALERGNRRRRRAGARKPAIMDEALPQLRAESRPAPHGESRPAPHERVLVLRLLGHGARATLGEDGEAERGLRSLELLAVLAMHPDGLSAEELALALYGESGKTVTIRAQVHRVRTRLGRQMVKTQPYRLAGRFQADWMQVQDLLAEGRPQAALKAYRGPLLPASEAPAIVEERMLLDEALRRSVLTTGDPGLLARWLAHASGTDDLAAARTLVAVLPSGDPRRAAATATLSAIARRLAGANGSATRMQPVTV